jgi:hypothetical protein
MEEGNLRHIEYGISKTLVSILLMFFLIIILVVIFSVFSFVLIGQSILEQQRSDLLDTNSSLSVFPSNNLTGGNASVISLNNSALNLTTYYVNSTVNCTILNEGIKNNSALESCSNNSYVFVRNSTGFSSS